MSTTSHTIGRRCFVTVGATASFLRLLQEVLSPAFLDCLAEQSFSELIIQTGPDHEWALQQISLLAEQAPAAARAWPAIEAVSYTTDMTSLMLPCRGDASQHRQPGAMISHAGSGSILDAVRVDVPLIVVANPDLLGNHQAELAEAVDDAGWAVQGSLGHLHAAVETLLRQNRETPPPYKMPPFPTAEADRCGLFDWAAAHAEGEPNLLQLD